MTSDRGRMTALNNLIATQDAGEFTLPPELTTAASLPAKLAAVTRPTVEPFGVHDAASVLLHNLEHDRDADLEALTVKIDEALTAGQRHDRAASVLQAARAQAESQAVNAAADLADKVITDHLRPAFEQVLAQAGRIAENLQGHDLDPRQLLSAPAKVRTGWLELQNLTERHDVLRRARGLINTAGLRQSQHDTQQQFATFADPHALTGYTPGSGPPPRIDYPQDKGRLLLWLVGEAAKARPWLPTVAEQDEAWWNVYGETVQKLRGSAAFAESVGARGDFRVDGGLTAGRFA